MQANDYSLMALEPILPGDWKRKIADLLTEKNTTWVELRGGLFVITERRQQSDIEYSDGLQIQRIWLGPRRVGLSVTSRRVYFTTGTNQVDNRLEYIILNGAA